VLLEHAEYTGLSIVDCRLSIAKAERGPSPMGREVQTRERLLDVAERLFSDQGYGATSGRQITMQAEANIAAIHYHFGGKKELLHAVLVRRQGPITTARLERLENLQANPDQPPTVEDILAAFLEPALYRARHPDNPTARISKLVSRLLVEKPKDLDGIVTAPFVGVLVRFLDALEPALPEISRKELFVRMSMVVGVLIHIATGMQEAPILPDIETPTDDDEAVLKPVIAFLAAGFRAPSTETPISIETATPLANGFGPAD
jgi:AcrR family transcriptional regulator